MKEIYLDHAATTYVRDEVLGVMNKYFQDEYGNPGSFHTIGLRSKRVIDSSRELVRDIINAKRTDEIIFTGSGTESVNLAIKGLVEKLEPLDGPDHIITSTIEHEAVIETLNYLEKERGYSVTRVPVDKYGLVNPKDVEDAIREDTILVTIMYANNEIGTIQPIEQIGKICRKKKVLFHTDACQAGGVLDLNVENLNVDMMTLNGSKIYGPKGIGMLYKKKSVKLVPLIHGGGQEFGMRSGTENVAFIAGFAEALRLVQKERFHESKRLIKLRKMLEDGIIKNIPKTFINGHPTKRLPNNANITISDIEGEAMMLYLNEFGICTSTGSACTSQSLDPSHVILACGLPYEVAHGTLRFTLGRKTTKEDIERIIKVLPDIVKTLRRISPVNIDVDKLEIQGEKVYVN
jgi:cysteine desulfurase